MGTGMSTVLALYTTQDEYLVTTDLVSVGNVPRTTTCLLRQTYSLPKGHPANCQPKREYPGLEGGPQSHLSV